MLNRKRTRSNAAQHSRSEREPEDRCFRSRKQVDSTSHRGVRQTVDVIVRYSTESDLPKIEGHYGRLGNAGDPFCDVTRIQGIRFGWLVTAEVAGEYAGFLYWAPRGEAVLRSRYWKVCPHQRRSLRKVPRTGNRKDHDNLCFGEAESLGHPGHLSCNS